MTMFSGDERRRYKRIKKRFMVNFQIKPINARDRFFAPWDMVAVLDLGAGGMLFYYNKMIAVNTVFNLKINVSPDDAPISCTGKAIRVERLARDYMCLVAVVFENITEKQKKLINKVSEEYFSKRSKFIQA